MVSIELSKKELAFILALLEASRQAALQLLAAEHAYKPTLLPKLRNAEKIMKAMQNLSE